MKRIVNISLFGMCNSSATIIIDKKGMKIVNKIPENMQDEDFIIGFISGCLDMDAWKHSWHVNISDARVRNSKARKKIRETLKGKIKKREEEIQKLKDCINVLSRWK